MKHPILTPTPNLAYILGVIKGDGCCYWERGKAGIIQLNVHDKLFADSFSLALESIGLNPYMIHTGDYSTTKWTVRAKSKVFVSWYKALSLETLREMISGDREKTMCFIRGFYESEGSLVRVSTRYYLTIANKDRLLIQMVQDLLSRYGFPCHFYKISDRRNCDWSHFRLTLCKQYLVEALLKELKPSIHRKCWR